MSALTMPTTLTTQESRMPTFDTPSPVQLVIDVVGDIRVNASDRADTVVTVQPLHTADRADVEAANETTVVREGDAIRIRTPKRWTRFTPFGGSESVEVVVQVPTGSRLEATTGLGDIRTDGDLGDCRLRSGMGAIRVDRTGDLRATTGHGSITIDHVTGAADVSTGSGEVQLGRVDGTAAVKNSNGRTWIGDVHGEARVKAANGDVVVECAASSITARSSNGDVRVLEVHRGTAVLDSACGELEVGVPEGVAAWLDVGSKFGSVRNDLDSADGPGTATSTVEVRAHTAVGHVVIRRADSHGADRTGGAR
jgi:DUF4097 and DUF4098 domain-containing protein YvlB